MTVEIHPEDEKLIVEKLRSGEFRSVDELIHKALLALPNLENQMSGTRKNLAEFLLRSPFAGAELDLERRKQYMRPIEL